MNLLARQSQRETKQAMSLKHRAVEPARRYCSILKKEVTVLIDYPDYVNSRNKGQESDIYCEQIVECYRNNVRCRYSGISPSFPDPFMPDDEDEDELSPEPGSEPEIEKEN